MVNNEFAEWAMPPAGIFGGNPQGKIWFCGIEFGGDDYEPDTSRFSDVGELPHWDEKFKQKHAGGYDKWGFQRKQAKIACHILENDDKWKNYLQDKLFVKNGDTFSMNLFPLSFVNTDPSHWKKEHYEETGFLSKLEYIAWCMKERFPLLKELVCDNTPAVLICTSSVYTEYFLQAFLDDSVEKFPIDRFKPTKDKPFSSTTICGGQTLLVLTPFLGTGGLMSNQSLVDLADYVKRNWRN